MRKINIRMFKRLLDREKKITLSTWLTLLRVMLVPFIVGAMITHYWGIAFVLFMIASFTDLIDGNLARLRNEKTFLGAVLDPIADKLLLLSVFFTLAFVQSPLFAIPKWFVWLVLIKEMLQGFGFILVYLIKGHIEVQPRLLGKLTTMVQMVFIMWLFACYFFEWLPIKTYYSMLGILLFLIGASFLQYAHMGWTWLFEKSESY